MLKWVVVLLVLASAVAWPTRSLVNDPKPNPGAVVVVNKNARFTVLTDRLIRLEWSPVGVFDDRASFAVVNRNLPVPKFTTSRTADTFILETGSLYLSYAIPGGLAASFTNKNLVVTLRGTDGIRTEWTPGLVNSGNLLGTIRTLDGVNGGIQLNCTLQSRSDLHCTFGLISTLGWNIFDESTRPIYDESPWPWALNRNSTYNSYVDWYFLGHGLNFKQALTDFTAIGGAPPLPPRFAFGIWWSRYWAYSDIESIGIISEYEIHDTPLDVFVTDMDWHMTFYKEANAGQKDQAGQPIGWSGYTWDSNLFPNPQQFLAYCKSKGLKNTLNLHPASGVQPWEQRYPQMALASGIDPKSQKYVPFNIENKTWAQNLWSIMLQPIEQQGIDFWWLDWQQGEDVTTVPGVNPTFWLNYVFFTNPSQWANGKRPLLFHRWGGLGNHRYQIGFTGDVVPSWGSLNFQPYFTATAANVGFAFWSHDIGGHTEPSPPEIYTRWVQWGVFAPILRTHCTKNANNDRRIWTYPLTNFFIMRAAIQLRAELVPYIYTQARRTHDTGVAFLRSLYFDYPSQPNAYKFPGEFTFGEDIVVFPVTAPVNATTGLTSWTVWIPPGDWIEWFSGLMLKGPQVVTHHYSLWDIPVFVKAGALIPMVDFEDRPLIGGAKLNPSTLTLRVFTCPGCNGTTAVYEDDGDTTLYQGSTRTAYAFTPATHTAAAGDRIVVTVTPPAVTFDGWPADRNYRIKVQGTYAPASVVVNKVTVPFDPTQTKIPSWSYDGDFLAVEVITPVFPIATQVTVSVLLSRPLDAFLYSGIPLAINRLAQVKSLLDNQWDAVYQEDYKAVTYGASTGRRMSYNPDSSYTEITGFGTVFASAVSQLRALTNLNAAVKEQAIAMVSLAQPATCQLSSSPHSVLIS